MKVATCHVSSSEPWDVNLCKVRICFRLCIVSRETGWRFLVGSASRSWPRASLEYYVDSFLGRCVCREEIACETTADLFVHFSFDLRGTFKMFDLQPCRIASVPHTNKMHLVHISNGTCARNGCFCSHDVNGILIFKEGAWTKKESVLLHLSTNQLLSVTKAPHFKKTKKGGQLGSINM